MNSIDAIKEKLKGADATKIFFTDLNGGIMSLPVNPDRIESIVKEGIGFDGSSIAGYATVENSDRVLRPEPASLRLVDFTDETVGFLVGTVYNQEGRRSRVDPRAVLENALDEAETDFGYRFVVGPEHEFFLLNGDASGQNLHTDGARYFQASPLDGGEAVRRRIVGILKGCGVHFEKSHHEVTPSQHEINLEPVEPLGAADRTLLFNHVTRRAAAEYGCRATFMPKPFDGHNRSAFHLHLSMQDLNGVNVFHDPGADRHLGKRARQFIAGILKYARETSIVMASTFNSYKAYVLEREAPIVRNWGFSNRSSMVRIPYCASPEATRLELRSPDPSGNVYLQLAVLVSMGMEGIRQELDCGRPVVGSAYKKNYGWKVWDKRFLPRSMFEALVEAEKSRFLRKTLGDRVYDNFMHLKIRDWEEHRTRVSSLEHRKYL